MAALLASALQAEVLGFALAIVSAIFNGTFSALSKIDRVKRADVDPFVFNLWACLGIALSGSLALLKGVVWTPLGVVSGTLFAVSAGCVFSAVGLIGVSVASGIWCGTAVLTSFLFDLLFDPHGGVSNLPLALLGIALLMAGICGIAYAGQLSDGEDEADSLLANEEGQAPRKPAGKFVGGLVFAVCAGFFGGLVLAPMQYAPAEARGIHFLPSMVVGVLIAGPIVAAIPHAYHRKPLELKAEAAAVPGLGAGVCWNIANVASMFAISSVGYGVAYPIMQCGLFVSGMWGIFLFGEIKPGKPQRVYWLSGLVLIIGAFVLTLGKWFVHASARL